MGLIFCMSKSRWLLNLVRLIRFDPTLRFRDVFITITGRSEGLKQAQFIMANIVKSNMHKLNLVSAIAKKEEKKEEPSADG